MTKGISTNRTSLPPRALENLDSFSQILNTGRVGLFSDFDGTLTPLVDDPRNTVLSQAMRQTLRDLSEKLALVAVVSGRDVRSLREMIGLEDVTYVGNHGLEEWKPGGAHEEYEVQVPDGISEEVELRVRRIGISGLSVEDKGLSVAVHYRNVLDPTAAHAEVSQMLRSMATTHGLRIRKGKMVLEIGPEADVNKGTAVRRLTREFELTGAVFLGDDVTDCDAFDALHELICRQGLQGAAVAVVDDETPETVLRKADYCLSGPGEVEELLRWMAYASPRAARKP